MSPNHWSKSSASQPVQLLQLLHMWLPPGPSTFAKLLAGINSQRGSLSVLLHAHLSCFCWSKCSSTCPTQPTDPTAMTVSLTAHPSGCHVISSHPATVHVEGHATQRLLCLPRGLNQPQHKGNKPHAPFCTPVSLFRPTGPRYEGVGPTHQLPLHSPTNAQPRPSRLVTVYSVHTGC